MQETQVVLPGILLYQLSRNDLKSQDQILSINHFKNNDEFAAVLGFALD